MPQVFRVMSEDSGKPRISPTARGLGVRPDNVSVAPDGTVAPNPIDGMSVAPTWRQLPTHRIPERLKDMDAPDATGKNEDKCWRMGDGRFISGPFAIDLSLRLTSDSHGVVQPDRSMPLAKYEFALAATQGNWAVDEL